MQKKAWMIGFVSLQGGVGKSTLASLLATNIWYKYPDFKISIWELDDALSILYARNFDLVLLDRVRHQANEDKHLEHIQLFDNAMESRSLYEIRPYFDGDPESLNNLKDTVKLPYEPKTIADMKAIDSEKMDLIFIDFPSTFRYSPEIQQLLMQMNGLIIPVSYNQNREIFTQKLYCNFLMSMQDAMDCTFESNVHMLWTRCPPQAINETQDTWNFKIQQDIKQLEEMADFPFPSLSAVVPESDTIRDNIYLTVLPVMEDQGLSNALDALTQEIFVRILR